MKHICKLILRGMREAGYDVCDDADVDSWTDEELMYHIDNYAESYIK